jgi:hypothetical protein
MHMWRGNRVSYPRKAQRRILPQIIMAAAVAGVGLASPPRASAAPRTYLFTPNTTTSWNGVRYQISGYFTIDYPNLTSGTLIAPTEIKLTGSGPCDGIYTKGTRHSEWITIYQTIYQDQYKVLELHFEQGALGVRDRIRLTRVNFRDCFHDPRYDFAPTGEVNARPQ